MTNAESVLSSFVIWDFVIDSSFGIRHYALENHSPLFDLALEQLRLHAQALGGLFELAVRLFERLPDLILQFPLLNRAVERALADAEHACGFLAVAFG